MVSVVGRVLTGLDALSPLACARLTLRCLLRLTGKRKAGEDTENGGQNATRHGMDPRWVASAGDAIA